MICRIAADAFAVRIADSQENAEHLLQNVLLELEDLETPEVRGISASIGVAETAPDRSQEALLAAAGAALHRAREAGGGRVSIFNGDASSDGSDATGADVAAALAAALEERDQYTGEHSESVVDLTARVAEALALRRA
jgi:predicted signal transduction protein with EAL and GGDEF domain